MTTILDLLMPLCSQGYLREATRLCVTSKELGKSVPIGTGKQIFEASRDGKEEVLKGYLAYWRDNSDNRKVLNWRGKNQSSVAIDAACAHESAACLRLLLSVQGADVFSIRDLASAIDAACTHESDACLRLLLSVQVGVDFFSVTDLTSVLHKSIDNQSLACLKLLVESGNFINEFSSPKLEALKRAQALARGRSQATGADAIAAVMKQAVDKRALQDKASKKMFRAFQDRDATLEDMVELWGSDSYVMNKRFLFDDTGDYVPMLTAACSERQLRLVKLLLRAPAIDVNCPSYRAGDTAIILAVNDGGDPEIVRELLLAPSIKPYLHAKDLYSSLHFAARNLDSECLRLLLETSPPLACPNQRTKNGDTPLFDAAEAGIAASIRLLLDAKADVNIVNSWNVTCLHIAVRDGRVDAVKELLKEPSIDLNVRGKRAAWDRGNKSAWDGYTALGVSLSVDFLNTPNTPELREQRAEIATLLRSRGALV